MLQNSQLEGNAAGPAYSTAEGGAVYSDRGTLSVAACCIRNNSAVYQGGGVSVVESVLSLLTGTKIANNSVTGGDVGSGGGAVCAKQSSFVTLEDTFLTMNHGGGKGGGLYVQGSTATIYTSTLMHNRAIQGGGVSVEEASSLTVSNSLLAKNNATGHGGGVILDSLGAGAITAELLTAQVRGNSALFGGGMG